MEGGGRETATTPLKPHRGDTRERATGARRIDRSHAQPVQVADRGCIGFSAVFYAAGFGPGIFDAIGVQVVP